MQPPPRLDLPTRFPEERIFRDILVGWSKGRMTYRTCYDEPMDMAYTQANNVLERNEKMEEHIKEMRAKQKR